MSRLDFDLQIVSSYLLQLISKLNTSAKIAKLCIEVILKRYFRRWLHAKTDVTLEFKHTVCTVPDSTKN
jgi:hypothetical protein